MGLKNRPSVTPVGGWIKLCQAVTKLGQKNRPLVSAAEERVYLKAARDEPKANGGVDEVQKA